MARIRVRERVFPPPLARIVRSRRRMRNNGKMDVIIPTAGNAKLLDEIIERIIIAMPIDGAMRCGVLCQRFENSWGLHRNLIFGKDFRSRCRTVYEFARIVEDVLKRHWGPKIERFHLSFDATYHHWLVKAWTVKVIEKEVEEINYDFSKTNKHPILPLQLLQADSITSLKLIFCQLRLDVEWKGLSLLKTVILKHVLFSTSTEGTATLFPNCLLLEDLTLVECSGIPHLKISLHDSKKFKKFLIWDCGDIVRMDVDAPTLSTLIYRGPVCNVKFQFDMPNLDTVEFIFCARHDLPPPCQVGDAMEELSSVKILKVSTSFLEKQSETYMDGTFQEMPFSLQNLKEFHLFFQGCSYISPYDIVSLLENCPNIEKLYIDFGKYSFECGCYWEMFARYRLAKCDPPFEKLKKIAINGFKHQKLELELVKFLLNKAKFLERIALVLSRIRRFREFFRDPYIYIELFHSWRTSPDAEIGIFKSLTSIKGFGQLRQEKIRIT